VNPQTYAERCANLDKGNAIRIARAELKVELKEGARTLSEVLRADEDFIQTMKLADLLRAVPAMGRVKAQRVLNGCRLSLSATVQIVTPSRREQLIAFVTEHHKRVQIEPEVEREAFPIPNGGYR
jgi:S13-like protein